MNQRIGIGLNTGPVLWDKCTRTQTDQHEVGNEQWIG